MHLQESGEMYLETIFILSQERSVVRSVDIADYMNYSKPSVSRAVGLLKNAGYINVDKDGFITLTQTGREVAFKIYDRHQVLSQLLMLIGVSEKTAVDDACKIEHDISDESFGALKEYAKSRGVDLREPHL